MKKNYLNIALFVIVATLGVVLYRRYRRKKAANWIAAIEMGWKTLDAEQIDSVHEIFQAWERYGDGDNRKLAYIFATAIHESGLKPIKEYRAAPGSSLYDIQNKYWGTGYFGRGFVQLTHESNYRKMSDFIGVDLVSNPDKALKPDIAAKILVYGMMNGSFTRKKLADYIGVTTDFYNSRRTVNGTDKAQKFADRADAIYNAL